MQVYHNMSVGMVLLLAVQVQRYVTLCALQSAVLHANSASRLLVIGYQVMVDSILADIFKRTGTRSCLRSSRFDSVHHAAHNVPTKWQLIKCSSDFNVQSPSCYNEHVDSVNKQWPPPFFGTESRSVVCHERIEQVNSTHVAVIVVHNSRLRNFNYCFVGHTPSLHFSNCFHRFVVTGNRYTLL